METNLTHSATRDAGRSGARHYVPANPSIAIDNTELSRRFEKFELGAQKIRWDKAGPVRIDWSIFDRTRLTLDNLFIVKLVTFVESYADVYTSLLLDKFCTNDTMSTFFQLWEREEQNHADQLVAYLHLVGLDPGELKKSLERPRQRKFDVPYVKTPLQANVFTYCQELLTAFFYQMFRRTVQEPLLNELLTKIIADEWRHFHWYEGVVKQHLAVDRKKTLEEAMPVFQNFAMPGNQILGEEYEMLTDEIVKQMSFSTSEMFAIGRHVASTFGIYEGGKLITHSSYARDIKDVMLRRKPPKPQQAEVVERFTADLRAALTAGAA